MKTLVAYGSRTGTTRRCAELIAHTLTEKGHTVTVADLARGRRPSPSGWDLVVLGAGARIGKLHPAARKFAARGADSWGPGKAALFSCCGEKTPEGIDRLFSGSYPPGVLVRARAAVSLGGRMVSAELPWPWNKFLAKTGDFDTVDEGRVRDWALSLTR